MLNLRMNACRFPPMLTTAEADDMSTKIGIMKSLEDTKYKCNDYMMRRSTDESSCSTTSRSSASSPDHPSTTRSSSPASSSSASRDTVDRVCRLKMGEWCYRVIDHFQASREIVAITFSYVDRFLDKWDCDRATFKLATMTALYIATKVHNPREISMSTLAELSRGEFDGEHIGEMEEIVLEALRWHMHPPTARSFVDYLLSLLSSTRRSTKRIIAQRAHFFTELAVLDYFFVTQSPSAIALAAILNALEGMERSLLSDETKAGFLYGIRHIAGIRYHSNGIGILRDRLWELYRSSEQFELNDDSGIFHAHDGRRTPMERMVTDDDDDEDQAARPQNKARFHAGMDSPVCVSTVRDTRASC